MLIHTSGLFEGREIAFHSKTEINGSESEILNLGSKVATYCISKFKEKCKEHFKLDFNELVFIEVYCFSKETGKEIKLFNKRKE